MGSFTSKHKLTRALKEKDMTLIVQIIMKADISIVKDMDPVYYQENRRHYQKVSQMSVWYQRKEIAKYIFYYIYHTIEEFSVEDVIRLSNYCLLEIWKDLSSYTIEDSLNGYIVITLSNSPTIRGQRVLEKLSIWTRSPHTVFSCIANNTNNVELVKKLFQTMDEGEKNWILHKQHYNFCDMLANRHFEMFQYVFGEIKENMWRDSSIINELEAMAKYHSEVILNLFNNNYYLELFEMAIRALRTDLSALGFLRSKYREENRERIQVAKNYITCPHDVVNYLVLPYL